MNVTCPACQGDQDIPDDLAGIEVRCPSCRQIFRAPDPAGDAAVAPGLPDAGPTATRKRPLQLDLEDDGPWANMSIGRTARNRVDLVNDAMAQTWFASQVMFWAGLVTAGNLVYNSYQFYQTLANRPVAAPVPREIFIGYLVAMTIFIVMLSFIFAASHNLYWLGPRWRIIVAIVVNFLFALLLGAGAALNVYIFSTVEVAFPMTIVLITLSANATSSALNLMAGILAFRTLANSVVNAAYRSQYEAAIPPE